MAKTYTEINDKIKKGTAVVLTAEEVSELAKTLSPKEIAEKIDIVTTATFGAMCSSGAFLNFGHANPPIRMEKIELNGIRVSGGLAAVDTYVGATDCNPENPSYGGAHIIEDLIAGKEITLEAWGKGTDCYLRKHIKTVITKDTINEAILYNPRNAYQNYNVAVNGGKKIAYTYMGPLKPDMRNVNFATAGCLSPLFNDPWFRTIGTGTRIFLGGGQGYVIGAGTQHDPSPQRTEKGLPLSGSGTLMVRGDLKGMKPRYLRGLSLTGYGVSLSVGVGIPIPILNEEMAAFTGVSNEDILMPVKDYGYDYPNGLPRVIQHVRFSDLLSGEVEIQGRKIPTVPLTSHVISLEIADTLKAWIEKGEFLLTEAVDRIPAY